jgi:glycosyltransferase involved in cell wall biosynthesis
MIKVLFLSAWYPNRYDAMAGLFVRKHAEAVSLYCDVKVLYVHGDKKIKHYEITREMHDKVEEIIVYYPEINNGILRKIYKIFRYFKANLIGYKKIVNTTGKPNIIHVNILTRTGFIALLIKLLYKIPYVVTEHWSRYFSNRDSFHGTLRKSLTRLITKKASAILPVSKSLKNAMINHKLNNPNYHVVNNVVDDFFFKTPKINKNINKRILHVSCFDESTKNIKGLLRAVKVLSTQRTDFELILVGTGIDYQHIRRYTETLNISDNLVTFTGELSPMEVATQFYNTDFFVIFSDYENSPVVISESLSCGKPVLSTNVGGISELVNASNGILIPAKDEKILVQKLNYMLDHYQYFDAIAIQNESRKKFSYELVGKKIENIYKKILNEI